MATDILKIDKISPIVLSGSVVLEGIGQMLVLSVGENTFKAKNNIMLQKKERNESSIGKQIDEFVINIQSFAKFSIILLLIIRISRVVAEFILIQDFVEFASPEWKNEIISHYYKITDDGNQILKLGDLIYEIISTAM